MNKALEYIDILKIISKPLRFKKHRKTRRLELFLLTNDDTAYWFKLLGLDHHKQWKILKEMRIPDHLTCLLYAGQEETVRTGHGTTD